MSIRVVFCSDTHLGLDTPARPRVERRRRGDDFFANFERVLDHARDSRASLVLHGGDVFFRSKVQAFIVDRVYARIVRFVEETKIPFGIIAGNHDRSRMPSSLLLTHPLIHVFHHACTGVFDVDTTTNGRARVAVRGVPFAGDGGRFVEAAREIDEPAADVRLLLAHEAFEGAAVKSSGAPGARDFVFRDRADVVPLAELPPYDVCFSGHIHRRQVLWAQRNERRMPVVYAGSVERTSFAERADPKTFAVVDVLPRPRSPCSPCAEHRGRIRFMQLPARPMFVVDAHGGNSDALAQELGRMPADAIVRISCANEDELLRASRVRSAIAPHLDVELRVDVRNQASS